MHYEELWLGQGAVVLRLVGEIDLARVDRLPDTLRGPA